jgi:hypothetical protein
MWYVSNVFNVLFVTDEAYFHVTGYVDSQNRRIWSDENPHTVHQIPLHDRKFAVWCALSARRVICTIFYHETVNSGRCVRDILEPFFEQLTHNERLVSMATFSKTALLRLLRERH